ncbi:hypothetical protein BofuT4_uP046840.1 [Botrytis cinerea T4]|uniref:Uncharacterized protein n=1 Tax=Botryotinia fuckeliana (strain T4) TaxID=999810 RepID=G2XYX9_BOTF4|nr:hypothetical protein BofuT4_uP046840.1 [Botrytis cinerea T4]
MMPAEVMQIREIAKEGEMPIGDARSIHKLGDWLTNVF